MTYVQIAEEDRQYLQWVIDTAAENVHCDPRLRRLAGWGQQWLKEQKERTATGTMRPMPKASPMAGNGMDTGYLTRPPDKRRAVNETDLINAQVTAAATPVDNNNDREISMALAKIMDRLDKLENKNDQVSEGGSLSSSWVQPENEKGKKNSASAAGART